MSIVKAIMVDVDGVLLDSLEPHLTICGDKNEEYGLALKTVCRRGLPSPDEQEFQGFELNFNSRLPNTHKIRGRSVIFLIIPLPCPSRRPNPAVLTAALMVGCDIGFADTGVATVSRKLPAQLLLRWVAARRKTIFGFFPHPCPKSKKTNVGSV